MLRFVVLVAVGLSLSQETNALDYGWWAGLIINNPETVGLPGYVKMFAPQKSGFLTKGLHLVWGNKLEEMFQELLRRAKERMPDEAVISDVRSDNSEKMTFLNGKVTGLKSIRMMPGTEVEVVWNRMGLPVAIVSVQFTGLKIIGDITKSATLKTVDGRAEIEVLEQNNFVLKFHPFPGIFNGCWLKLYDVLCSDLNNLLWTVRRHNDDTVDNWAGSIMQNYFANTEDNVENHIKTTIDNVIYQEIPLASRGICHNNRKFLRLSKYQKNDMRKVINTDEALYDTRNISIMD